LVGEFFGGGGQNRYLCGMKETLVFATNNAYKLEEAREILGERFVVKGLAEIGCHDEIPETADTIEGNAEQKARYVKEHYAIAASE